MATTAERYVVYKSDVCTAEVTKSEGQIEGEDSEGPGYLKILNLKRRLHGK